MFNNYFFGGDKDELCFKEFLEGSDPSKVALVMDPPFGGLLSVLAGANNMLLKGKTGRPSIAFKAGLYSHHALS